MGSITGDGKLSELFTLIDMESEDFTLVVTLDSFFAMIVSLVT